MRCSEIVKFVSISVAQDRWGISAQYKEGFFAHCKRQQIPDCTLQATKHEHEQGVCANIRSLSLRV